MHTGSANLVYLGIFMPQGKLTYHGKLFYQSKLIYPAHKNTYWQILLNFDSFGAYLYKLTATVCLSRTTFQFIYIGQIESSICLYIHPKKGGLWKFLKSLGCCSKMAPSTYGSLVQFPSSCKILDQTDKITRNESKNKYARYGETSHQREVKTRPM